MRNISKTRRYTPDQIRAIVSTQTPPYALSTNVAYAAGLTATELYTLQRAEEREADPRASGPGKFQVRNGAIYTVVGKYGRESWLCRNVLIPMDIAQQLEDLRRKEPKIVRDRGLQFTSLYAIPGGNSWASALSRASYLALGRSSGTTGLRHAYAQERTGELQRAGHTYNHALLVVAHEMGLESSESVEKMLV